VEGKMTRKIKRITDLGSLFQSIFADLAGVLKTSDGGLDWTIKGTAKITRAFTSATATTVTVPLGGAYSVDGGVIDINDGNFFTYTSYTPGTGVFAGVAPDPTGPGFTGGEPVTQSVRVGENAHVMVFNSDVSVHFIAFGDQTVGAPSAATDGLPVLAGEVKVFSSGENDWVRSDDDLVFAYVGDAE
jgi:hypothetical protein